MYEGLNKIFKGTLLVFFHINIGPLDILPDFLGVWLIMSGCKYLYEHSGNDNLRIASNVFAGAFVFSLLVYILTAAGTGASILLPINIILATLNVLGFTYFYEGLEVDGEYIHAGRVLIVSRLAWILYMVFYQYSLTMTYQIIGIGLGVITFIITIIWIFNVKRLRDTYQTI